MKKLLTLLLIVTLTLTVLCSCDEDDKPRKDKDNTEKTASSTDAEVETKLPAVDTKTGKINIDEPIVPVELHTNSYLYTVLTYNENGDIIGATDYNTNPRFSNESVTTYEYVKNDDGTVTLYEYSDHLGYKYEYDGNGNCISSTYYSMNRVGTMPREEIFQETYKSTSTTYQYDSIGRVISRTSYTDEGEAKFIIYYTYNDDNFILSRTTTYPSGETYESFDFSLNENGDYSEMHKMSLFWEEDTVIPFEWSYKASDDILNRKVMNDEHGKIIEFTYQYGIDGSLDAIRYYHAYEIVPVQYFLGEGALMEKAESAEIIVFMPLSKVLAKQNQGK